MTPTETLSRRRSLAAIGIGLVVAAAFGAGSRASAQFAPGNIVALRIGNGTTGLSTSAAPGTLIEINSVTGVATGFSVALPTAASSNVGGITFSGTRTSAPYLHRSTDGTLLTVMGYDAPVGSLSVDTSSSLTHNRTVARIDSSGATVTQRLTDSTFSGGQARSVISDGTQLWLGGTGSVSADRGLRYVSGPSATGSTRLNSNMDVRDANIFNSRLFFSAGGEVHAVTGSSPPTSGTPATTLVSGGTSITGFVFFDRNPGVGDSALGGLDTLYMADGVNLLKVEYTGASWSPQGSVNPTQLDTTFGLTGVLNGSNVELYATDTNGNLAKIIDTSSFGTAMSAANATNGWGSAFAAGANFTLRGVEFAPTPVPEPGTVLAVAAVGLGLARLRRRKTSPGRPTP